MTEVTTSNRTTSPTAGYSAAATSQGVPQIHVHGLQRHVFGNEISIVAYGEMKIAAGEYVWARELLMNSLQVLTLTSEIGFNDGHGYIPQKSIWHKGEWDNYASIDIFDDAGEFQAPGTGPVDGSVWLNFIAEGEAA